MHLLPIHTEIKHYSPVCKSATSLKTVLYVLVILQIRILYDIRVLKFSHLDRLQILIDSVIKQLQVLNKNGNHILRSSLGIKVKD